MVPGSWLEVSVNALGAVLLGVLVPWVVMRLAFKSLAESPGAQTTNFRGSRVSLGLGTVWLVWSVCASTASALGINGYPGAIWLGGLAMLSATAFGFGLIDDAYGTSAAKGFRGHIGVLRRGVLTTGGMKLIGISGASLIYAFANLGRSPWMPSEGVSAAWGTWATVLGIGTAVLAAAAIALSGNVMNLTDLRPGRASKVYLLLLVVGFLAASIRVVMSAGDLQSLPVAHVANLVADVVWLAGPVLAVIGLDLSERGMLGDAGANPMGVIAGAYITGSLGVVGVAIYFVIVLVLNVASERVSFSRVIEANAALSWVDNLGRLKDGSSEHRE